MTSTNNDHKSPAEIEREVEEARARLQSTLGDIRESLSPGQMLDQALDYARDSGGAEFTRNLGRSVRDNPLPVALIGAGISWLLAADKLPARRPRHTSEHDLSGHRMAAGLYTDPDKHHVHVDGEDMSGEYGAGRQGFAKSMSGKASSAYAGASGAAHSAGERASSMAHSASDRASGMAHSASDRASGMAHSASEALGSARQRASEFAHDARDRIAGMGSSASDYASHAGGRLRDTGSSLQGSFSRMIDEQPLILGAIGLAIGAAIGAALPTSRAENRMFGSTADRVKGQAADLARQGFAEAETRSREAVREVADTLDERGYSARGAADALGAVAETVKSSMDGKHEESRDDKKTAPTPPSTASSTSTSTQANRPV